VQLSPLKVDDVSVIVVTSVHNNYAARSIDDLQKGAVQNVSYLAVAC
jgi:hypothetical protein